jgi:cytochrome c oxidase subunit 2
MSRRPSATAEARAGRKSRPALAIAIGFAACGDPGAERIAVDTVAVRISAHDVAWNAAYVTVRGDGATVEISTAREVHLPIGAAVSLELASRDYICLFAMPDLGLRDFAAPGLPAQFHFRAERAGSYELRGDELCGLPHTEKTRGRFVVEDPALFQAWVRARVREAKR